MTRNQPPTANETVTEPITTDAIARIELDELEASAGSAPLTLEVDVPRSVLEEITALVDEVDNGATARDFLLERVNINLEFTAGGEPVDLTE